LERRSADWPFTDRKLEDIFAPEIAEPLTLALIFEVDLSGEVPVPYLAELADRPHQELTEHATNGKESAAGQIQDLITERLEAGESISDILLIGFVYKFWLDNERPPTLAEIAALMKLSRQAFHRRYSSLELNKAYLIASGEFKRDLPDPDGLDPVQRANRNAKKPGFSKIHRDPFSDN